MRTLSFLVMLSLALAGCSGDDSSTTTPEEVDAPAATTTTTTTQAPTDGGSGGATTEPEDDEEPENRAPAGTLTASISQGDVPVDVAFTFEGTDPDGDELSWTFDADGDGTAEADGTELPASYDHSYADVGTYTANLTISDGDLSVSYEAIINATEAAVAPVEFKQIVITGTISGMYVAVPLVGGDYLTDPNHHDFEVPGVASSIHFYLEFGETGLDLDFDVFDADGEAAGDTALYNDPVQGDGNSFEELTIDDPTVLDSIGTWGVDILSAGSLQTEYTMTITFTA